MGDGRWAMGDGRRATTEGNRMRSRGIRLSLTALFAASTLAAQDTGSAKPYLDESLSFEQRARDLVSRMTLEEKVLQMKDVAPAIPRLGVPEYNWWNDCLLYTSPSPRDS